MSPPAFILPSFAKINLSLHVLGRRSDGYHEVRTVLQTVSLHDELHFSPCESDQIIVTCSDRSVPLDGKNLVVRAAHVLRRWCGVAGGARIHLQKQIPPKGGLGGGSSNAAMALLGLSKLWNPGVTVEELRQLGAELGADVPFFLWGGRALAQGIGTQITPLSDTKILHLVIVKPKAEVSTAEAYKRLNAPALTTSIADSILSSSHAEADLSDARLCTISNDFERVVFESEPETKRVRDALLNVGAETSLLCGSGSSVFGIFESKQEQERAVDEMKAEPGWRVFPAVTVSRSEYEQVLGKSFISL